MLGVTTKRPADTLDYDIEFSCWLTEGDSVLSAEALPRQDGITVDRTEVHDDVVKVWVSGGDAGNSYDILVTASTVLGRIKETKFSIRVAGC